MAAKYVKSSEESEKKRLQVIKNIRALLISAPSGLTVEEIQSDHQSMIGKPLPYREMGYSSALDLIKDLPDVCRPTYENGVLVLKCIADDNTRHIARLVARQKSKKPKSRRTTVAIQKYVPKPTVPYYVRTCVKQLLSTYPAGILGSAFCNTFHQRFGRELDYARHGFKSLGEFLRALPDIVQIEHMQGGGFRVYAVATCYSKLQAAVNKVKPLSSYSGNAAILSKIPQSTSKVPESAILSKIPRSTTKVPESAVMQKVKDFFESQMDDKCGFNDNLKEEIKAILKKRKNGIWAARLPVEYKNMFQKELHVRLLGFSSVVELVGAMPEIVNIDRPTKTGDWYLTIKSTGEDESKATGSSTSNLSNELSYGTKTSAVLSVPFSGPGRPQQNRTTTTFSQPQDNPVDLPDAVVKGTYYSKLRIPESGDIELFVSYVIDPGFFWIILIEHWPKLEALAEDLRVFYFSKEGEKYKMPEWLLSVGQVCCALYDDGAWYRALIVGIHSIHSVEVFYVDYGNVSKVSLSNLRVMRSPFVKLPAQAIQCRLANIKPHGDEWSPGAIHRLYHMTKDFKPLVGLVCGSKGEAVNIYLCDTTSEKDIFVNDALLEEGFADIAPDSPAVPSSLVPTISQTTGKNAKESEVAPGLPPPRPDQQQMNQQIAALLAQGAINYSAHRNPPLPDFPLPVGGYAAPYFNFLQCFDNTASVPSTAVVQELPTGVDSKQASREVTDNEMSAADLKFMEEICQELEQNPPDECLLKRIQLTEKHFMHVVNIERKPYVISAEISAFFWDDDLLRSMLRQKKLPAAKVVLSAETNENLFQEIVRCGVKGSSEGGKPRSFITLYELQGIPEIMEAFNHPSKELFDRMKDEVDQFNREGENYWMVKGSDSESAENDSESQEEAVDVEFHMEELRLMFQAMQFRRKRILQNMLVDGPGTGSTVDELKEVEAKIQMLKLEMEEKERQEQHQAAQKVAEPPAPPTPLPCISPSKPIYPVFFANPHVGMVYSGQLGRLNSD